MVNRDGLVKVKFDTDYQILREERILESKDACRRYIVRLCQELMVVLDRKQQSIEVF